jgi:hypothetical protein
MLEMSFGNFKIGKLAIEQEPPISLYADARRVPIG